MKLKDGMINFLAQMIELAKLVESVVSANLLNREIGGYPCKFH